MCPDFVDMLSALSAAEADFLVVGAHALAVHGVARATGDLDLWVRPTLDKRASGRPQDLADVARLEDREGEP